MNKVLSILKEQFGFDDLALLIGALFIIPFALLNSYYMNSDLTTNPPVPFWLGLTFGIASISIVVFYIFYNLRIDPKKNKFLLVVLSIVFVLIVSNMITTLINPHEFIFHSMIKAIWLPGSGTYLDILVSFGNDMKAVFIIQFAIALLYIYAAMFLLVRKINNLYFLRFLSYGIYIAFLVSIIFSLFTEINKYGEFFNCLFNPSEGVTPLAEYSLFSFFSHRNIYAMFIVIVIITSLLEFSLSKKKINLLLTLFASFYLFLTYSKAMIMITYVGLVLYFYSYQLLTFRDNKKQRTITLSIVTSIIAIMLIVFLILYFNNSKVHSIVEPLFSYTGTMASRKSVWATVLEYMQPFWYLTGRGYGIGEVILKESGPLVVGEFIAHEHSWFYSLLSKGGVLLIAAFIVYLGFTFYLFFNSFKKERIVSLSLCFGFLVFFIQSFIENSYYMLFVITAILIVILNNKKQEVDNID